MNNLKVSLVRPGCAEGRYTLRAKSCILAVLSWGTAEAPLAGWGPFAYIPIDPAGNGSFSFPGRRGIPREADHVWARCYAADFGSFEDISAEIPVKFRPSESETREYRSFSIFTDLHLVSRPWRIRKAFRAAESDTVFLLGDMTNDGIAEQFAEFRTCIEEAAPEKTFFPVTGNHDVLQVSPDDGSDGCGNYNEFQKCLLTKAEGMGHRISFDPDGRAYAVQMGGIDLIGLQCVTQGRRFLFPERKQIDWLDGHLDTACASWHIILCHAPLLAHNPNRNTGAPYLHLDSRIQKIAERTGRVIFLSGHTHRTPNSLAGNCEYDAAHQNIYLDCGSVAATETSGETGLMSTDWNDGCRTELKISRDTVEICMSSIETGIHFPRGFYRLQTGP